MATSLSSRLFVKLLADSSGLISEATKANRTLGSIERAATRLQNTLIGTFGAYHLIQGIGNAVKSMAEFERQMASVRAISGATNVQLQQLRESAISIGGASLYSAKQVAELQVEFARLGFSTEEILNATEATVDLATATGENLARSAEIAGSTMRAFALDSEQMTHVTDVMAEALNKTALTLDSYADAIKYVSPVAHATGVSLEEVSAMLGVLSNAGIKGSQAGTSLRRIFTLLTQEGGSLQERMQALAEKGITLADAHDEVGLYAQTALLVLARETEQTNQLAKGMLNLTGTTKELASVMKDNLAGDMDRLSNSWDSLIQRIDGSSVPRRFYQGMQNFVDFLSGQDEVINTLTYYSSWLKELGNDSKLLDEFRAKLIELKKDGLNIDYSDYELRQFIGDAEDADEILKQLKKTIAEVKKGTIDGPPVDFNNVLGLDFSKGDFIGRSNEAIAKIGADKQAERIKTTVNGIKQSIKDLNDKIGESNSRGDIANYTKQINDLEIALWKLQNNIDPDKIYKNAQRTALGIGSDVGGPLSDILGRAGYQSPNFAGDFQKLQGKSLPYMADAQNQISGLIKINDEDQKEYLEKIDERIKKWGAFGNNVAGVISNVISADKDFGKSIKKTTADILRNNAVQIASFLAKKFAMDLSTGKPFPLAVAALTAGIGVVAGLLGKDWKKGSASSKASSGVSSQRSTTTASTVIRGQDLHVVMKNYNGLNRSTRG